MTCHRSVEYILQRGLFAAQADERMGTGTSFVEPLRLKPRQQVHEVGLRRLEAQSPEGDFVGSWPQIHSPGNNKRCA